MVVSLKAAEGKGDDVAAAFGECIVATHAEEGCLKYALHRNTGDPDHLLHVEVWRSQADIDAHFQQPYLHALLGKLGEPGLLAGAPDMWTANPSVFGDPAKGTL